MVDRSFTLVKLPFRKSCTYDRMLQKCVTELYPDHPEQGVEYYIADGSGLPICAGETIRMDCDDGEQEIPWELQSYIRLSNQKYASRAQFYCVQKFTGQFIYSFHFECSSCEC